VTAVMTTENNAGANRERRPAPAGQPVTGAAGVPPAPLRVLIVEDETFVGLGLRSQVEQLGHAVVGQAADAPQALDLFLQHQPDVVLMDVRLDGPERVDGVELAEKLMALRRCPMIIVSAYSDQPLVERAGRVGVFGYLIKPVRTEALSAQLEVAVRRFAEHERLAKDNQQLTQTLENRKVIERAKGIFMKRLNLDEPEAHRRLQLESQKRRVGLVELAKKIIESEELLGGA
jgi:AmiR/NasT family two-component response regulator